MPEGSETGTGKTFIQALKSLPLLGDDLYLGMQAMNLGIVDDFLMDIETQLLREYIEIERTPMASATFVSALTQLWIFGVYELLRTWRQHVREVLKFLQNLSKDPNTRAKQLSEKEAELEASSHHVAGIKDMRSRFYRRAAEDPAFAVKLQSAFDASECLFHRLEILRIHLAKHELHKSKGSAAFAPGYARINMETGTMYYQVTLPGKALPGELTMISRRDIADGCRDLLKKKDKRLIPVALRKQLKNIPEWSYGVKCVRVTFADGTTQGGVFVNWDTEITGVRHRKRSVDARKIIQIEHDASMSHPHP